MKTLSPLPLSSRLLVTFAVSLLVACSAESPEDGDALSEELAASPEDTSSDPAACTIDDVRGPYTHFTDGVPLVALGISCATEVGCYRATVPHHETVICRQPDGAVTCTDSSGTVTGPKWGYDCCVQDGSVGGGGYQCYWFDLPVAPAQPGAPEPETSDSE